MTATSSATSKTFFFRRVTISRASPLCPMWQASLPVLAVRAMLQGKTVATKGVCQHTIAPKEGKDALFQHVAKDEKMGPSGRVLHAVIVRLHRVLKPRRWELEPRFVGNNRGTAPTGRKARI